MFYALFLFILVPFTCFAKPTVCLNMIVKNESNVICRCLDSVKPLIDYWVIVDTGSTDGTQQIIRNHLKDIPGELFEREWKNFGFNRTEALQLAKNKGDYLLIIDADDILEYSEGFKFGNLDKECYHMWRGSKDFRYLIPQVIKNNLPWKWVSVVHEYLDCGDTPIRHETLQDILYTSIGGGARAGIEKFFQYITLLEEGIKQEPHNERYAFYLGESYRDANQPEKAIEWYQKRIEMGGWPEEVYWSYYQIAYIKERLGYSEDEIVSSYNRAHRYRPHRPETVFRLAAYLNRTGRQDLAYETLKGFEALAPTERDTLFNEDWMKTWGIPMELAYAAYSLGKYIECFLISEQMLKQDLDQPIRDQVVLNQGFALEKIKEQGKAFKMEVALDG